MIDAMIFIGLLRKARVKWIVFAQAIERPDMDVYKWMTGESQIPPYISLTIDAVRFKIPPVSLDRMCFADIPGALGIEHDRVKFWVNTRAFPLAARLAVAAHDAKREQGVAVLEIKPDRLDINSWRVLTDIMQAGKFYRVHNGWRARPTLGRSYPKLRVHTPDDLKRLGLVEEVQEYGHVFIRATAAGQTRFYARKTRR